MKKKIGVLLFLCTHLWAAIEWSAPITLSIPQQDATSTVFDLNLPSNQALAAWVSANGTHTVIQAALFNGTSWSSLVTLSDPDFDADEPHVAINNAGHAMAVWRKTVNATTSIVEASFFNGTTWSSPVEISSESDARTVDGPGVAIDPATDEAVAIWRESRGIGTLRTSKFDGASWTTIPGFNPEAVPTAEHIVINGGGTAVTAWITSDRTDAIETSVYTDSWSSPAELADGGLEFSLCKDKTSSRFMILWSTLEAIQASMWEGSSWSTPETLLADVSFALDPYITSHPSKTAFAAVWRGDRGVQGAIFDQGAWSENLMFSEVGFTPRASFNEIDGTIGVVWALTDRVQFCEYTSSGFSTPVDISGISPNSVVGSPRLGIDSEGKALAVWYLSDGTHTLVQAVQGTTLADQRMERSGLEPLASTMPSSRSTN